MENNVKSKINNLLENVSHNLLGERGCSLFWGEIEPPECLKNDVNKIQKEKIKGVQ